MIDERCEHGVPLGKDNPNLPCSRCEAAASTREEPRAREEPVKLAG